MSSESRFWQLQAVTEVVQEVKRPAGQKDYVYRATKYLSPKLVVRATRIGKPDGRNKNLRIALHIGRPNYAERQFIKACKKAGEPFPVRHVILKWRLR